jgi:hypothetical protein
MTDSLSVFIDISTYLTGFDAVDLQGTGMAATYLATVVKEMPADTVSFFFETASRILREGAGDESTINAMIAADLFPVDCYGGLAQNIILMWYLGQWPPAVKASPSLAQARNISPDAYVQGLVWAAANTHPPGAKQPGYGSWASPPLSAR